MRRGIESDSYRAVPGAFRLRDFRPDALPRGMTNTRGAELLENNVGRLRELQEQLYADGRWSLLVILQGMDTAGKDSAIKRVFSGLNPQGCARAAWRERRGHPGRGRDGRSRSNVRRSVQISLRHP
jgi:polyphosphate kinase 2 (PPK2 family)